MARLRVGDPLGHRRHEAQLLAAELGRVRSYFHDRDVVVLGDFNTYLVHDDVETAFEEQGLRDANAADVVTRVRVLRDDD